MVIRLSRKMAKICNSERDMKAKLGEADARKLQQRLAELQSAETLEDMRCLPAARGHELTGDRKGQLAVDLVHPRRLVFEPDQTPPPTKEDGGLDWKQVTRIVIVEIVDYH